MKGLSRKVVILTVFILANVSFAGTYSGGSGTEADPYQIGTVGDWNELMDTNSDWDANFIMTADINLQGVPLIPVGNNINDTYYRFTGIFDGNGHVVRNAEINMRGVWHIGLFGVIDDNSQILNLGVEDVNMSGERDIAGLVGCNEGTITNCYATGKIGYNPGRNGYNLGGLVGLNYGTITGSHAACDVNGNTYGIGGLVGLNYATITDSYANGIVNGDRYVGGLVGENYNLYDDFAHEVLYIGTISHCYANGSVSGNNNVGGLAGANTSPDMGYMWFWPSIAESYSICSVTGGSSVGGLVGKNYCGKVIDCYATGEVTGNVGVGGLLGENLGQIVNCYAAGRVTGNGAGLTGGPVGYPDAALNCFWDIEATSQTTSAGGTGLTTAEMKTLAPFLSAGWDFVDTWGIGENQTYPFLRTYSGTDLNYDGCVNFIDFAVWANHWLEGI
jgi:hypothetical protein